MEQANGWRANLDGERLLDEHLHDNLGVWGHGS